MAEALAPFFDIAAADENLYPTKLSDVPVFLANARNDPHRTVEFEFAILSAFRRQGHDASTDSGWKSANIRKRPNSDDILTYDEAATSIRNCYIAGARQSLFHMAEMVRTDPYDYVHHDPKTPLRYIGTIGPSGLAQAAESLRRAHLDPETDAAWQAAGIEGGLNGLRTMLQDMYIKGKVGGYANIPGVTVEEGARRCADYHLKEILPNAGSRMGITAQASATGKPTRDLQHS